MRLGRGRRRRQRTWQLIPQNLQEPSPTGDGSSGCRKSRWLFSTACNNAGIFVPRSGTKILASLHARLAEQGLARHLIRFEAGFAPSSSPCEEERLHARQGFIDTQKQVSGMEPETCFYECCCADVFGEAFRLRRRRVTGMAQSASPAAAPEAIQTPRGTEVSFTTAKLPLLSMVKSR